MALLSPAQVAPTPPPAPPAAAAAKDDARLRRVAAAVASAFFHAQPAAAAAARAVGDEARARLFEADAGEYGPMVDELVDLIRHWTPYDDRVQFIALLRALDTKAGTLALAGPRAPALKGGRVRSFTQLAPAERETLLLRWLDGPLPPLAQAVKGLKCLVFMVLFRWVDPATGVNPLWAGTGYPGPPPPSQRKPVVPAKLASEAVLVPRIVDVVAAAPKTADDAVAAFRAAGVEHVSLGSNPGDVVLTADAVVVGSGAGGGVAAGVLARAGLRVVVLEKGRYTKAADLPLTEAHGFPNMYERGTLYSTKDLAVNVLAGATLGGGTRINWCASFPTPDHVRAEWAAKLGVQSFSSRAYDRALAAVCGRAGVSTGVAVHSNHNACLGAGLEAIGHHRGEIPRNCSNAADCGGCCVGCGTGEKQDTTATFLADAAAAGAWIVTGVHAEKVTTAKGGERGRAKRATGVVATPMAGPLTPEATLKQRLAGPWRLVVAAPLVVAAAGTMHTPALLLRSGVKSKWVGANLRLHPATMVYGRFPAGYAGQDPATGPGRKTGHAADPAGAIKMWEGAIMSTFSNEKAGWGAKTPYGPMLMTPSMHVSGFSATTPWRGCGASKAFVANYGDWSPVLVITRDRDAGRVFIDGRGMPRYRYWGSRHDRASMTTGIEQAVRVLVAAGAVEIGSFMEMDHFVVDRTADGAVADPAAVEAYIAAIRKAGIKKNRVAVLSAHQMGTARMAATAKKGAVDGVGESFAVSGLLVADGAAFPTSSGVNPMMTIEAIGYMVAEAAAERAGKRVPPPAGGFAPADHCASVLASSFAGGKPPVKRGPVKVQF